MTAAFCDSYSTGPAFWCSLHILDTIILGAFAKLRKSTISFVMSVSLSVRPSIRMEQLGSHWSDFHDI